MKNGMRRAAGAIASAALLFMAGSGRLPLEGQGFPRAAYEVEASGTEAAFDGFSYRNISEEYQEIYRTIYQAVSERKSEFVVWASSSEAISMAIGALLEDCPQFFWIDGTATMSGFEALGRWTVSMGFNVDAGEIDGIQARIDAKEAEYRSMLGEGASDYEKVRCAYEYIIKNTDYDLESPQNQNIQSVFLNGRSVCAGYSRALQYLLLRQGVECAYIEGNIEGGVMNGGHAWNLVWIDGVATYVDPAWGDPTFSGNEDEEHPDISYDYLCLTTEEMERTGHTPEMGFELPNCSDRTFDYYVMNDMFYETADADRISRAIWYAVDEAIGTVSMKFADRDSYDYAKYLLFPEDGSTSLLDEPLQQRMAWDERDSIRYYYHFSSELYILKVYW